jgi:uncharacterized protein (TIGR00296 family)
VIVVPIVADKKFGNMEATKELCFLCFEALCNKVTGTKQTKVSEVVVNTSDTRKCPLFVTWNKAGKLRGCIGSFSPLPLYQGLQDYAVISGTRDHRFTPIVQSEFPSLECGISLLHSFEPGQDALDWEIGVHGIRLFIDGLSATYLPEVAKEWKWTKEQTLVELAQKAGLRTKFDAAARDRARIERYQSAKCVADWGEYMQFIRPQ